MPQPLFFSSPRPLDTIALDRVLSRVLNFFGWQKREFDVPFKAIVDATGGVGAVVARSAEANENRIHGEYGFAATSRSRRTPL